MARRQARGLPQARVRDTYRSGDDIRELLDFRDAVGDVSGEDIQDVGQAVAAVRVRPRV